jgi:chromosome segregation protein
VVNNLEEGLNAVYLLDANQKGKANFFLLDKVNNFAVVSNHQPEVVYPRSR